jgi:hypothetical protein
MSNTQRGENLAKLFGDEGNQVATDWFQIFTDNKVTMKMVEAVVGTRRKAQYQGFKMSFPNFAPIDDLANLQKQCPDPKDGTAINEELVTAIGNNTVEVVSYLQTLNKRPMVMNGLTTAPYLVNISQRCGATVRLQSSCYYVTDKKISEDEFCFPIVGGVLQIDEANKKFLVARGAKRVDCTIVETGNFVATFAACKKLVFDKVTQQPNFCLYNVQFFIRVLKCVERS